jgi:uncharacterized protein
MIKEWRAPVRRWLRRLGWGFVALLLIVIAVALFGWLRPLPGDRRTPDGLRRNTARYVPMRDGTRLAVEVWLPGDFASNQRVPTVFRATRYFRALEPGPLLRILQGLQVAPAIDPDIDALNNAGFAHVIVDVRGTGASFGRRSVELSSLEIDDLSEVLDWVANQPWSNGRVGLFGMSYDGNVAELLAARGHPTVRAVAPIFSPWDDYQQPFRPGGLLNLALLEPWGGMIKRMDEGTLADVSGVTGWRRWLLPFLVRGPKPVDEHQRRQLLAQAKASHATMNPMQLARTIEFSDDVATNGASFQAMSPAAHAEELARCGIPLFVQASWLDSDYVAAALQRFEMLPNPQTLVVGAWSHGGTVEVDPFSAPGKPSPASHADQFQQIIAFMKQHLDDVTREPRREIRYVTLNEGAWKTNSHWPPDGLMAQHWYFHEGGRLDTSPPTAENAGDPYAVDFELSTGLTSRWLQLNPFIAYNNLGQFDQRRITYTSPPLQNSIEVTGTPMIRLHVSSTATDGAFHAYLEDVAPDGRVTYVTEGVLRALHRKVAGPTRPGTGFSIQRSFKRADALPLVPDEPATLEFELLPTSVVFRKAHRIRLALAGADAGNFERVPAEGSVQWRIHRDTLHPSQLELPFRDLPLAEHAPSRIGGH